MMVGVQVATDPLLPPPVRYAVTPTGGHVAFQIVGEGVVTLLAFREWTASVDSVWEHPAHLRFIRYWSQFARCVYFDPRGAGVSDPVSADDVGGVSPLVVSPTPRLDPHS